MPNDIVLLVTVDKFDPNPILVKINKLKPYMFIEDITLQPVLADLSDVVIDEHVLTKEPEPLLFENANFELVKLNRLIVTRCMAILLEQMYQFIIMMMYLLSLTMYLFAMIKMTHLVKSL